MPLYTPKRWVPKTVLPNPPGIYGPAIWGDDLNNAIVGGSASRKQAYRFRAEQSSTIDSIRFYIIGPASGAGYGGGTGGTIRVTLESDNGGVPSGSVLSTATDWTGAPSTASKTATFPSPYTVTSGTVYHLVFTNVDAAPAINYCSVDLLYVFSDESPWQPRWTDNKDWAHVEKVGTNAWTDERGSGQGTNTPILQIVYGNGSYQGMSYLETWGRATGQYIACDGTKKWRETFTSTVNKTLTGVYFRLARTSGSGDLSVRLETGAGVEIETGTIAAASISTATKGGNAAHGDGQRSYYLPLANRSISNGSSYNLVFSTTAGTEYWTTAIRQGSANGYNAATYWADGNAQVTNDGTTWTDTLNLSSVASNLGDIQFYFVAV